MVVERRPEVDRARGEQERHDACPCGASLGNEQGDPGDPDDRARRRHQPEEPSARRVLPQEERENTKGHDGAADREGARQRASPDGESGRHRAGNHRRSEQHQVARVARGVAPQQVGDIERVGSGHRRAVRDRLPGEPHTERCGQDEGAAQAAAQHREAEDHECRRRDEQQRVDPDEREHAERGPGDDGGGRPAGGGGERHERRSREHEKLRQHFRGGEPREPDLRHVHGEERRGDRRRGGPRRPPREHPQRDDAAEGECGVHEPAGVRAEEQAGDGHPRRKQVVEPGVDHPVGGGADAAGEPLQVAGAHRPEDRRAVGRADGGDERIGRRGRSAGPQHLGDGDVDRTVGTIEHDPHRVEDEHRAAREDRQEPGQGQPHGTVGAREPATRSFDGRSRHDDQHERRAGEREQRETPEPGERHRDPGDGGDARHEHDEGAVERVHRLGHTGAGGDRPARRRRTHAASIRHRPRAPAAPRPTGWPSGAVRAPAVPSR